MDLNQQPQIATQATAQNLKTVAASPKIREASLCVSGPLKISVVKRLCVGVFLCGVQKTPTQ